MKVCTACRESVESLELTKHGDGICLECRDNEHIACYNCDELVHEDESREGGGNIFCGECFEEMFVFCESCEEPVNYQESYSSETGYSYCEYCYCEIFSHCEICVGESVNDEMFEDYDGRLVCEYCYDEESSVDLDSYILSLSIPTSDENSFEVNKFKRACGIELETVYNGSGSSGEVASECHYNFTHTYDGSISGDGVEFISRPMVGDRLFSEVDHITDWLHDNEFSVNRSCGYHLHIDARDLYWPELTGIMLLGNACENIIYSMMPSSRSGSNWCKKTPISSHDLLSIQSNQDFINSWYSGSDCRRSREKYNDSRYHGINMHSRVYLGTIEFRHHSGTTNPMKIKNWITICQSLVEKGAELGKHLKEGTENKLLKFLKRNTTLTLPEFIEILELESIDNYILKRINKFSELEVNTEEEVNNYITI